MDNIWQDFQATFVTTDQALDLMFHCKSDFWATVYKALLG